MEPWLIAIIIIGVALAVILSLSIRIVKQGTAVIVERLGKYYKTLGTGMRFVVPFIDRALPPISLKEQVADFKPQPVITKDNVTMQIDSVVFFQIVDPKLYTYGIERPMSAIENLTATTLRNIVGELELDETLSSRDTVNTKMREIIDTATDPWGIKVNRVELKNILPPAAIQESMEKQMRAERERRENILLAEGEKRSKILVAEGEKEAEILKAEARKIALLTEAEGQKQAIEKIVAAKPDIAYLTLQGYEALKVLAQGEATKIIVPNDLANVSTLFASIKETVANNAEKTSTKSSKKSQ
ncbi:MAG: SPFH/Band 7/PHB domain protein [Clostridia bacterium]|nr:SPFH/Band 7/PHB domain protein [Clostridia bacterium]